MKKPAIPPVPQSGKPRGAFDLAVKQRLEILSGERGKKITLDKDATPEAVRDALIGLLALLQ